VDKAGGIPSDFGMPTASGLAAKLLLLGVSTLVALGIVEVALRNFLPVRGLIYQLDQRYLYRHIPGARKLAAPAGQNWPKVLVRINAQGRRGDEPALAGRRPIIVYGDSFVAAEYTPDDETFVSQLGRLLARESGEVPVLNAGVTGYGVDQEVLAMEDDLPRLRPSTVVLAVYAGNDFGDLLRNKLFRLDHVSGALQVNRPVLSDRIRTEFAEPFPFASVHLVRLVHSVGGQWGPQPRAMAARGNSTQTRLAARVQEYDEYVHRANDVVDNLLADEYDADVSVAPRTPSAVYRKRLMARVLARAKDVAGQHGVRLLLLIIPERCDVIGDCPVSVERRAFAGYQASGLTDALQDIATAEGIPFVNLFTSFRDAGPSGLYLPLDGHWNTSGQAVAAKIVAEHLRD
jgi:lysophospholipase L1-like esterase